MLWSRTNNFECKISNKRCRNYYNIHLFSSIDLRFTIHYSNKKIIDTTRKRYKEYSLLFNRTVVVVLVAQIYVGNRLANPVSEHFINTIVYAITVALLQLQMFRIQWKLSYCYRQIVQLIAFIPRDIIVYRIQLFNWLGKGEQNNPSITYIIDELFENTIKICYIELNIIKYSKLNSPHRLIFLGTVY